MTPRLLLGLAQRSGKLAFDLVERQPTRQRMLTLAALVGVGLVTAALCARP